jgi:hypothetical protein
MSKIFFVFCEKKSDGIGKIPLFANAAFCEKMKMHFATVNFTLPPSIFVIALPFG